MLRAFIIAFCWQLQRGDENNDLLIGVRFYFQIL